MEMESDQAGWQNPIPQDEIAQLPEQAAPIAAADTKPVEVAQEVDSVHVRWYGVVFLVWVLVALGMILLIIHRWMFVGRLIRQGRDAGDKLAGVL
jgi:hypothetical protein